jgi:hypothetical protein
MILCRVQSKGQAHGQDLIVNSSANSAKRPCRLSNYLDISLGPFIRWDISRWSTTIHLPPLRRVTSNDLLLLRP